MAKVSFRMEGLRELETALKELSDATGRTSAGKAAIRRVMVKRLRPMRDTAASLAPKDKGTLSQSIIIGSKLSRRQKRMHKKDAAIEVFMGPAPLRSATQQEFGNALHRARAYMRPAFDQHKRSTLEGFADDMKAEIEKTRARVAKKAERLAAQIKMGK